MDKLITMSKKELSRLEIMQRLEHRKLKQKEAAHILGISVRQVKRLYRAYREKGAEGLVSQKRGRSGNHQLGSEKKKQVIEMLYRRYRDFGPTLASEKLNEVHGLRISRESVRQIMIAEGLWKPKRAKRPVVHQMRERRACFGELVQIDGSPHHWFEERGPACNLLVFIDDATGRLGELHFTEQESFYSYGEAARRYFARHGKPVAFYSDKHGIFRVNIKNALSGSGMTQFGRAMKELDIQIICANSPQAKGRVERVNQTLQDRLVKELRLKGISNIDAANAFMPEFIEDFNQRFAVVPRSSHDMHRTLSQKENFDHIFSWQETRTISKNLTIQFEKVVYQIQTKRPSYALRKATVTVCKDSQNRVAILYKGHALDYTVFHIQAHQAEVLSSKQIGNALNSSKKPYIPPPDHPWRKSNSLLIRQASSPLQGDTSI